MLGNSTHFIDNGAIIRFRAIDCSLHIVVAFLSLWSSCLDITLRLFNVFIPNFIVFCENSFEFELKDSLFYYFGGVNDMRGISRVAH